MTAPGLRTDAPGLRSDTPGLHSGPGLHSDADKPGSRLRMPVVERGMGATALVAAIASAFGVVLLHATGYLAAWATGDPYIGTGRTVAQVVGLLSVLLVGVAVYVAAIVTANTFATIVAGRTRRIALLRLIGASARSQRTALAREGLLMGSIGAVVGLVVGTLVALALRAVADDTLGVTVAYQVGLRPVTLIPAAVVVATTWAAAWVGSRPVLSIPPLAALGAAVDRTAEQARASRSRQIVGGGLLLLGAAGLGLGVLVGLTSPWGVVIAFVGGVLSFTGLTLSATLVMPPLLRATGRLFGRSTTARLAAGNALRHPDRSSRMAIGVVLGVALVTMFAVANASTKRLLVESAGGYVGPEMARLMDTFAAVMMTMVAVSAVIAAVGLVNLLTIGVVQRRRELGLLRTLGLTAGQIRRMVLLEAAHLTVTSLVFGLLLGIGYGWAAAQSLLGSVQVPPEWASPTLVAPALPAVPVLVVVLATAVLTLVATVVPTRLATRVSPIAATAAVG